MELVRTTRDSLTRYKGGAYLRRSVGMTPGRLCFRRKNKESFRLEHVPGGQCLVQQAVCGPAQAEGAARGQVQQNLETGGLV